MRSVKLLQDSFSNNVVLLKNKKKKGNVIAVKKIDRIRGLLLIKNIIGKNKLSVRVNDASWFVVFIYDAVFSDSS